MLCTIFLIYAMLCTIFLISICHVSIKSWAYPNMCGLMCFTISAFMNPIFIWLKHVALSSNITVGLGWWSILHCLVRIPCMVRSQTASLDVAWKAKNFVWFVEVAATICLTNFHAIGTPFLMKIYPVWSFFDASSVLKLESTYHVSSPFTYFL